MDRKTIDLVLRPMQERRGDRDRASRVELVGTLHSVYELWTAIVVARACVDTKCHDPELGGKLHQCGV